MELNNTLCMNNVMGVGSVYAVVTRLLNYLPTLLNARNEEIRSQSARLTNNRLKAQKKTRESGGYLYFDEIPSEEFIQEIDTTQDIEGAHFVPDLSYVPALHEFREILGVDPVVRMTANKERPLSHISQYRLAVYVSGLPEGQRAAVYNQ